MALWHCDDDDDASDEKKPKFIPLKRQYVKLWVIVSVSLVEAKASIVGIEHWLRRS